jgi:hypothetical protein
MPMLVRIPYGFKVLRIYPDSILIFTYEEENGAYRQAGVYQRITIPARFRLERGGSGQEVEGARVEGKASEEEEANLSATARSTLHSPPSTILPSGLTGPRQDGISTRSRTRCCNSGR